MKDKISQFDAVTDVDQRAQELFERDEMAALRGERLASAEGDWGRDEEPAKSRRHTEGSMLVAALAQTEPERFMELVGYLPHAIQDIFYQYYLLGRTQTQIGELMGKSRDEVRSLMQAGTRGVCAVIRDGKLSDEMLEYRTPAQLREELVIDVPEEIGEFRVSVGTKELGGLFAPKTFTPRVEEE